VRHPATLGSSEVEAFLSWLANERKVSVSTHRQALAALLFFYGALLQRLAAVRGRLSLCADQAAAAKWWLSMPMASVSAEGPMP
ncbi:phage integrase N-terminal SAM-like domain-containing protein, partial [Pseudomonas aeruginosa]|uniref:phage integrase N-terminal SAM-like domain-containing protein n=1 Tax=Pseudomonas aeruginosa TaxID=287 RepID=UPI001F0E6E81